MATSLDVIYKHLRHGGDLQTLGQAGSWLLVAITGAESYKTFDNIVRFPGGILVLEVQSFFIHSNPGFDNSFKGSHEYGIVEIAITEGW